MSGNPVETGDASLRLAVNCDIATPMERPGDGVDAFLDVLVRADGSSFVVHDRDAFEQGLQRGLLLRAPSTKADCARIKSRLSRTANSLRG